MQLKLEQFLRNKCKCTINDKVLVATSGGIDSVVLCQILNKLGQAFAIAHCNFKLRGEASDKDADFVENLASILSVDFYKIEFETEKIKVKEKGQSTQMLARSLRYNWLEKIRKENGYSFIATAHHADDQLETILLNITRGTGISGLKGMLPKNGFIIRPMLTTSKDEILNFANLNNIIYREDSSNAETKYNRNKIRHLVIPHLKEINPAVLDNLEKFTNCMIDVELLYKSGVENYKNRLLKWSGVDAYISVLLLQKSKVLNTLLYETFIDFSFNSDQTFELEKLISSKVGKQISSLTHRVLKDRKHLIVTPLQAIDVSSVFLIEENDCKLKTKDFKVKIKQKKFDAHAIIQKPKYAFFDADKVVFPLTLRKWKAGDYFYPFGMTKPNSEKIGKKKLKRFFSDVKVSIRDKEKIWVMQDATDKIIWVVGWRIDARLATTSTTQKMIKMQLVHLNNYPISSI